MQSFLVSSLRVIVGTTSDTASFTVEGKNGLLMENVASSSAPTEVDIPADFVVSGNGFSERNKGIRIFSPDEPIFVIVEQFERQDEPQHSTYLAYPPSDIDSLYEYVVVSLEDLFNSQFLLVGCNDNTTVTIVPSVEVSIPQDVDSVESEMIVLEVGDRYSFTLDELQSLLVSNFFDLTGTKIVSNKPLTVISGHECASLQGSFENCEHLAFQTPPSATWGTQFLLAPFAGRSGPQKFRLVSREPTSVEYNCGSGMQSTDVGLSTNLLTDHYCAIESQNPIFVVQIASNFAEDGLGDPAIALVSPIDQYVSESKFVVLSASFFSSSKISVTVPTEYFTPSNILLDGAQLDCEWEDILFEDETVGYGCSFIVSASESLQYHIMSHNDSGKISVLVYGFSNDPFALGYAYLAGQSFTQTGNGKKKSVFTCVVHSVSYNFVIFCVTVVVTYYSNPTL